MIHAPQTLVNTLRSRLSSTVPTARVGGPAAQNRANLTAVLVGRAPYAIGVILSVAFLLLLIVFRSLVIALTSILMRPPHRPVGRVDFADLVFQPASAPASSASSTNRSSTRGHHSSFRASSGSRWTTNSSCSPRSENATKPPATPNNHQRRHRPHRTTDHQRRARS